jgi:hypothetical protein
MSTARVIDENEVFLGGFYYNIARPPQETVTGFPGKVTIGETTGDSGPLSTIRWTSARQGIGKKDHKSAMDVERIWYGTSHLRVDGHRTLPDRVTTTAASGETGVFTVGAMEELSSTIYAAFGTSLRSYAPDTWTERHTLAAAASDAINCRLGGTVYLLFAVGTGYAYSTNGSSWTNATTDVEYFECWDDRLWGIDSTGQLRWTFSPSGTWTDDAQLPLPNDYVQDLFVGRDAGGNHILYASTKVGLFAHDAGNNKFVRTELELPFHDEAGAGVTRFRDATYIPAGLGVYKYALGGGGAVITIVGPDRDQGLPAAKRGKIIKLVKSHNDLIALVDNTAVGAEDFDYFVSSGMASHGASVLSLAVGQSLILGWDTTGWQVLWESGLTEQEITYALVSNALSEYRLWWAQNERVHHMDLPVDILNPAEISDREYADSSRDEFPWFDGGQSDVVKTAARLSVEVEITSSTETVTPYFAINGSTSWTALSAISSDGTSVYTFPNTAAGTATGAEGTEFREIRFRTDLANGTDNQKSPDVRSMTLEFRKKLTPTRRRFTVQLDLNQPAHGQSPKQQRANLNTAIENPLFQQFTFRDDDGNTRNYYVDILNPVSIQQTGHDERGITQVVLVEA